YLRVTPAGEFVEALPIPVTLLRGGGLGPARGIDARGAYYWAGDIVGTTADGVKRNQSHNVRRWRPPSQRIDTVAPVNDHAIVMHASRFYPFAEKDAWVVAPDGRLAVLAARHYRLRWFVDGKVVAEGPSVPFAPI